MKKYIIIGSVASFAPLAVFAGTNTTADTILTTIQHILNVVIPVLVTLAVVYFIWGIIQYTISSDEEAKKKSRSKIIMSLIGLFIIVAFWGIVQVLSNTFDVGPNTLGPDRLPCIPNPYGVPPVKC